MLNNGAVLCSWYSPWSPVLYCTMLYCTVLYYRLKLVLTMEPSSMESRLITVTWNWTRVALPAPQDADYR